MNAFRRALVLAGLVAFLAPVELGAGGPSSLPARYRVWLDEEVAYLITPRERDVFLKLQTDREREVFIDAFWTHRDPTPDTPENEFKTEHYRRIVSANHRFGRVSSLPGWKTDRGRIFIILGEPNSIEKFEGRTDILPAEVWFYQDRSGSGLPAGFNLVFFQEGGMGDFRLYNPATDGPMALIRDYRGRKDDFEGAYATLRDYEPDLASVSLSLIPGDSRATSGRPSLASTMFLNKVETLPQTLVKDGYAAKFLEYKDIVDVEYSAHYLDCDDLLTVARADNGDWLVHYALEPQRLSVSGSADGYQATFRLNGNVADMSGKMIHQFEKTIQVRMEEGRLQDLSRQPFDLRDLFPLIPGRYRFSLLVKNEASKEFMSFDRDVVIPDDGPRSVLTRPLLAYHWERVPPDPRGLVPFQFGPYRVDAQPGRIFARSETLTIVFQVLGLPAESLSRAGIRYQILKDGQVALERERSLAGAPDLPTVLEEFPLNDLPPAHYAVKVSLLLDGQESVSVPEEFDLTHRDAVPRPWVRAKIMAGAGDVAYEQVLGAELFNAGRLAEARSHFEKAFRKDPTSAVGATLLAKALLALGDVEPAAAVLAPFCDPSRNPDYDLLVLAGSIRERTKDWTGALGLFETAASRFGIDAIVLGHMGDCQWALGRPDKALAAWQKSLEILPNQPELRKKVEAAKARREGRADRPVNALWTNER